jgi:microcin C transport system permease protein
MRDYFIRRLLLIPPVLLGISLMVFALTRMAPGGPIEQAMMQMQQVSEQGGGKSSGTEQALSSEQLLQMKRLYGFDKPVWEAYLIWLGLKPREIEYREVDFPAGAQKVSERISLPSFHLARLDWNSDGYISRDEIPPHLFRRIPFQEFDHNQDGLIDGMEADEKTGWITGARERINLRRLDKGGIEIENRSALLGNWDVRMRESSTTSFGPEVAEIYMKKYEGLFQGNLGNSIRFGEPVISVIADRLPVSTYFGILTFLLSYIVCIPLGVFKALNHKSVWDDLSSIVVFIGYAVPGYALGSLLLLFLSVKLDWLPMSGLASPNHESMNTWERTLDLFLHTIQPLACYLVGGFAFVTMLMKNHLLDHLAADYVRTAMAKGLSFSQAVRRHALRNSLVPLATNVGHQVTLFVTGSFLIETIFDIDGFGLLGFNAVIDRDYPVVMGVLGLSACLMLLGNVLADALVAWADPRVRFER